MIAKLEKTLRTAINTNSLKHIEHLGQQQTLNQQQQNYQQAAYRPTMWALKRTVWWDGLSKDQNIDTQTITRLRYPKICYQNPLSKHPDKKALIKNYYSLCLNKLICCSSFENPKQMFKLIDKKIMKFLSSKFCLTGPMAEHRWCECLTAIASQPANILWPLQWRFADSGPLYMH